jgi:drug/metabolite transporter (DMT)-like permease
MGIFFGLAAALFWGVSDFVARQVTQRVGTYRTLFFMQFIGILGLSLYLVSTGILAHLLQSANWRTWMLAIVVALLNIFSSLALYRSFEIGVMAIVSPIAASSSALTVLLALLSGERLNQLQVIGIVATLIGVILAVTQPGPLRIVRILWSRKLTQVQKRSSEETTLPQKTQWRNILNHGVGWALTASVGYSLTFWLLGIYVAPVLGGIAPIWLIRLLTPCVLSLCAFPLHQSVRLPKGNVWWLICVVSVLDTAAFVCAALGLATRQVAIVSILASLFSAITVILAWIFLHERLRQHQWLGIVIIFLGIILVKG